jgi:predicted RND superfamily exporter protein
MFSVNNQRRLALFAFVALFLFSGLGATRLKVTDDASEAMLPTDPETAARYKDYLDRFPNDQGALVIFENLLCSDAGWELIKKAEAAFRANPSIDRTLSLASMSSRYVIGCGSQQVP